MDLIEKMDLLCVERMPDSNFAKIDPVIFNDDRVVTNMLELEKEYIPSCDYFTEIQQDVQPFMRKVVTSWMLEVCEEQMCEDQVFPLAVNFFDRFLCECCISKQQLQLLGATTLLMASKIRQCHPLQINMLCAYTDNSVTPRDIRSWEMLVLSKLKWDITAVTGFDYVDHLIERIPWGSESPLIRRHSHTLVSVCYTEPRFIQCPPSIIATACICSAARGINSPSSSRAMEDLCAVTGSDPEVAEYFVAYIESIVARQVAAIEPQQARHPVQQGKMSTSLSTVSTDEEFVDFQQPETPTDVQDIHF